MAGVIRPDREIFLDCQRGYVYETDTVQRFRPDCEVSHPWEKKAVG